MANMAKPEIWSIDKLKPYDRNSRNHPKFQIDIIKNSIKEFGFINPIIVKEDGEIIAGHGRLEALTQLGIDQVPVLIVDYLTTEQVNAYRIADNQIAQLGSWDQDLLKIEITALSDANYDLELLGFQPQDLEDLIGALDEFGNEDENLEESEEDDSEEVGAGDGEPQGEAISQAGEVYWLGPHRLYCGSSLEPESWSRLMGAEKADLCFTDPPYGIGYNGGGGWLGGKPEGLNRQTRDDIQNDELTGPELYNFLLKALGHAKDNMKDGAGIYVCCADSLIGLPFREVMRDLELWRERGGDLVWVKNRAQFGRTDYQYQHEQILYGWKQGAPHFFTGDRTKTTTLFFKRPAKSGAHPTMKPVDLVRELVMNASRRNAVVIDAFGGSGTTMIACATVGREARLIELSPHYCDVIRRRWAKFAIAHGLEVGDGIDDGKSTGTENFDNFKPVSDAEARSEGTNEETEEIIRSKY